MRKYLLIIVFVVFLVINAYAKTTTIKSKTPSSSAVKEFSIDEDMHKNNQQLIKLILNTESMDDEERQYWFDIMPSMTKEQVSRLFNILETERKKLEELDKKYQKEIDALNGKNTPHKDIILLVYKSPLEETWKMYTPIKEKDFIPSSMSLISFKDNLVLTPSLEKYILSTLDNKEKYRFYSSKVYSELQHIDYLMFEYYLQKKIIRLNNLLSKLAQYKDIDEKSAIAYLQCKEYILILDEDKSKFINFYLDKNNSKVFSMTFDWVYFLKKSITDKRLLNNYSELSKENNEKWLKKSEALQTQPIIAEYVCSINSIDENHQFRHFLKDKVITRIKDTHYKQLNRLYFQNDDGSAILEQYNKTYKAYKEDSRSDYNDSKIQLSRTNGEKALEYGAYTILKLLKESEKYFGFNYLRYQDLIKNIHKDIKYIYINDRDDNVSRFIEREINDRYIANVINVS